MDKDVRLRTTPCVKLCRIDAVNSYFTSRASATQRGVLNSSSAFSHKTLSHLNANNSSDRRALNEIVVKHEANFSKDGVQNSLPIHCDNGSSSRKVNEKHYLNGFGERSISCVVPDEDGDERWTTELNRDAGAEQRQTKQPQQCVLNESLDNSLFWCYKCFMCFTSQLTLDKHVCLETYFQDGKLEEDFVYSGGDYLPRPESSVAEKKLCGLCGKTFDKVEFESHVRTHGKDVESCLPTNIRCDEGVEFHNQSIQITNDWGQPGQVDFDDALTFQAASLENVHKSKKQYVCSYCGKSYSLYPSFQRHVKHKHLEQFSFRCEFCNKGFRTRTEHGVHVRHYHTLEKPFQCPVCEKTFFNKDCLKGHVQIHMDLIKEHLCHFCGQAFLRKGAFKRHIQTHTGEKPHCCEICGMRSADKRDMVNHMKTHTKERGQKQCDRCLMFFMSENSHNHHFRNSCPVGGCYVCRDCLQVLHSRRALVLHMQKFHDVDDIGPEKKHVCMVCDKTFIRKSCLDGHILTHTNEKEFECSVCLKRFSGKQVLSRHMRIHLNQPFVCPHCSSKFRYQPSLYSHLRKHCHAIGTYLCRDCPAKFASRERLLSHFSVHDEAYSRRSRQMNDSRERPFVCNVCFKSFAYKHVLENHLNSHNGKQFKCPTCSKAFTYKSTLLIHMKISCSYVKTETPACDSSNPGQKPFQCNRCLKFYSYKNSLWLHQKKFCHAPSNSENPETHSVQKPFQCDQCLKFFSYKNSLWLHKKKFCHSPVKSEFDIDTPAKKPFQCDNCFKYFSYSNSLWLHKKKFCRGQQ